LKNFKIIKKIKLDVKNKIKTVLFDNENLLLPYELNKLLSFDFNNNNKNDNNNEYLIKNNDFDNNNEYNNNNKNNNEYNNFKTKEYKVPYFYKYSIIWANKDSNLVFLIGVGEIVLWDLNNNKCLNKFNLHNLTCCNIKFLNFF
jgi:hypothetical protein